MLNSFKKNIKRVLKDRPGRRFRNYYSRSGGQGSLVKDLIYFVLSVVCFAIALVLSVTPGPAILFWVIGLALLSSRVILIARWLDQGEINLRKWGKRLGGK